MGHKPLPTKVWVGAAGSSLAKFKDVHDLLTSNAMHMEAHPREYDRGHFGLFKTFDAGQAWKAYELLYSNGIQMGKNGGPLVVTCICVEYLFSMFLESFLLKCFHISKDCFHFFKEQRFKSLR